MTFQHLGSMWNKKQHLVNVAFYGADVSPRRTKYVASNFGVIIYTAVLPHYNYPFSIPLILIRDIV